MAQSISEIRTGLQTTLARLIKQRLPGDNAGQVEAFASSFYATMADEDIVSWRPDDLCGATLSAWEFLQSIQPGQPKVRVYNPDFEQHGWQSVHTIVQVLSDDLPFTLDSMRVELNHRNIGIHSVHNSVLTVKRDDRHQFVSLLPNNSRAKTARHETLITLEIDRHADSELLKDLQQALDEVLYQVGIVVEDFRPMETQLDELVEMYGCIEPDKQPEGLIEAREFLQWLKLHFTFLGYDQYQRTGPRSKKLEVVMGSQLGLLKYCDEYCRSELIDDKQRDMAQFTLIPELLLFTKSPSKSRVHRPAYPDYITLKRFDETGRVIGESRFLGLYTSGVYLGNARQIPVVRKKVAAVLERSGRHENSHDWKELQQILEVHPRDDLFQASIDELYKTTLGILHIHERRQIRLFARRDEFGQYASCLVYAPRDVYSTEFRLKVEKILLSELGCNQAEFNTYFSESILARTHFVLRSESPIVGDIDVEGLQRKIQQAARSWSDELYEALIEAQGEEQGIVAFNSYGRGFASSYKEDFPPRTAVVDIQHMDQLDTENQLSLSFYSTLEASSRSLSFKLFNMGCPLPLSDVLPVLENLGLRVIDEHPYAVKSAKGSVWIHDFNLQSSFTMQLGPKEMKAFFQDAFMQIWQGKAANDGFNRLVLGAGLTWQQVNILRAYAAYMKQMRFPLVGGAVKATLNNSPVIARKMVGLFEARFQLGVTDANTCEALEQDLLAQLDSVESLNEDKIIRQLIALIKATQRTNYYQTDANGIAAPYLAFKLTPGQVPQMPEPKPIFEIFVFSPRFEGVHLRGGKVARGGLRWSDRYEDYRTEVLGLVKAQQVKNAVIVPVGAKGGFVAKGLNSDMTREEWLAEGVACYQQFISALLDLTDNLVDGDILPPAQLTRHDEDDPYLVVAADKGTATFSDIANGIAEKRGFWLGDAFASGGSQGYDHKKMGITAKGAWVSVERHFRELGVNVSTTDFSVVAVGDMSGDVFGNGMLLSKHICLLAAFNHLHIFIDPRPDAAKSWSERQRLFKLSRSGWDDYDKALISRGGGVFKRTAKSIAISTEMKRCFDIAEDSLPPNELISRFLCAPIDLFWNGGIGTYVKASFETDEMVGDKANDTVRVNACDLRCRVIGEGGNLGITQEARMEYARHFGRANTDFIDNAAGVDCSDHEVNIKILLNGIVADGDLTSKQRNQLLQKMTEDVARLVLKNNYRQVQAISLEQIRAVDAMGENRRYIQALEHRGLLNRGLEFLPDEDILMERQSEGAGLTRPEISVLISYSKAELKQLLLDSCVPDDDFLNQELATAFPETLTDKYSEQLSQHRLSREIVATQLANNMVNYMGFKFVDLLRSSTRAEIDRITRAYVLAREVFDMQHLWQLIESLDYEIDAGMQLHMMDELQYLVRRATRWFVVNRPDMDNICAKEVQLFRSTITELRGQLGKLLCGQPKQDWHEAYERYIDARVPEELAMVIAGTRSLYAVLNIIEVAGSNDLPVDRVAQEMFEVAESLQLHWLISRLNELDRDNQWQALARESFRDDIDNQHRVIVTAVLNAGLSGNGKRERGFDVWKAGFTQPLERWLNLINDLKTAEKQGYAMYTVAISELIELGRACK
ncbi:NAD-glutamate dehydrogenase [Amphritea balenae]|uniref:NAD-glutamate dehydrogenase n=1 Tax=Amphritea balenae TaxID=452629 RepID=A0A3P1STL5_9GAMM|nr:NAD-glutamate dehydrogenase [Amphritea balenae]RRD00557.1 NAD-glutamate dehydrogenase [Amphritea balenae]GGK69757.1 NAD-specific glutamate dehydrogenase [Amphritea balenae]